MRKLVIIGNGMAGIKFAEKICSKYPDHYNIEMFSEEDNVAYNRILLSSVLANEKSIDQIETHNDAWYQENNVALHKGLSISEINWQEKKVMDTEGNWHSYDKLVIATGSSAFRIPIKGHDLPQVVTFRDLNDVNLLLKASQELKSAVVIGGGLLGLEAAYGLQKHGMQVSVIHLMDSLMEKQLDSTAALLLKEQLEKRGMKFHMEAFSQEVSTDHWGRVEGIKLKDGSLVPGELVVMAVGIKPRIELAAKSEIPIGRGITIDQAMKTSIPHVYAVGECVELEGETFGLVAPLFEMAEVLAKNLNPEAQNEEFYEPRAYPTKLKVSGIDLYSSGQISPNEGDEELIYHDKNAGVYRKVILNDNLIKGILLFGNTDHSHWYQDLLEKQEDVSDYRQTLLFGPSNQQSGSGLDVSSMPDESEVCGCNGVSKGDICEAIEKRSLCTLEQVKTCTKAGTGCGSCEGQVNSILQWATGGESSSQEAAKVGICACTEWDHDEIRSFVFSHRLDSVEAAFQAMGWKNRDGCHKCRPAVNYYLLAANPGTYQDDPQSRFVNERVHANIQKDGTFSVIPRMFGGLTTPDELRAIADAADEFDIPCVKVTGGQRIDLLGVKKKDLPAVWGRLNDAGMVSGHAYGKSLRTVKTCVGSEWCRFGTQDSTSMGVDLEKMTWGSWTPHKFKMAVSGCKRNCAEATIKDFGVVAVESGWELYVGGNGGAKIRECDLLVKVDNSDDVLLYCGAFMQLYRENARYLERTAPWVERVGLDWIKEEVIESEANRKVLYERFLKSQEKTQIDPWETLRNEEGESFQEKKLEGAIHG